MHIYQYKFTLESKNYTSLAIYFNPQFVNLLKYIIKMIFYYNRLIHLLCLYIKLINKPF